jgi:hypothetical protein
MVNDAIQQSANPTAALEPNSVETTPPQTQNVQTNWPKRKKSKALPIVLAVVGGLIVFFILITVFSESIQEHGGVQIVTEDRSTSASGANNGVNLSESYENKVEGISFQYPSAWQPIGNSELSEYFDDEMLENIVVGLANEEDDPELSSYIIIYEFTLSQADIDMTLSMTAEEFEARMSMDVSISRCENFLLDDVPAKVLSYHNLEENMAYHSYYYAVGTTLYRIDLMCSPSEESTLERFFVAIMDSYKIIANNKEAASIDYDLYSPIVDAYAALEDSNYSYFDAELIGDSLLSKQKDGTYNFGWEDIPTIMYSLQDLNGDHILELLIGADSGYGCRIAGIYALQNNRPVSILQVRDRELIELIQNSEGNCVIKKWWGSMGYAEEVFYTIDEDGRLVTLDATRTDSVSMGESYVTVRYKDVSGEEVEITEEAYVEILRKHGANGYEGEYYNDAVVEISVTWHPALTPSENEIDITTASSIQGEVLFQDVSVTGLLNRSMDEIISILGMPPYVGTFDEVGGYGFSYDDIDLTFDEVDGQSVVRRIWLRDLSVLSKDGLSLDRNQAELIAALGEPYDQLWIEPEGYTTLAMRFLLWEGSVPVTFTFWLHDPSYDASQVVITLYEKTTDNEGYAY